MCFIFFIVRITNISQQVSRMGSTYLAPAFLIALCCTAQCLHISPMSHLAYQDNLLVSNWYYGNLTPMQYRLRLFQTAADEVTNPCPLDQPFVASNMQQCLSCPIDRPLRNLATYGCEVCPMGSRYDHNLGNCTQIPQENAFTRPETAPANQTAPQSTKNDTEEIASESETAKKKGQNETGKQTQSTIQNQTQTQTIIEKESNVDTSNGANMTASNGSKIVTGNTTIQSQTKNQTTGTSSNDTETVNDSPTSYSNGKQNLADSNNTQFSVTPIAVPVSNKSTSNYPVSVEPIPVQFDSNTSEDSRRNSPEVTIPTAEDHTIEELQGTKTPSCPPSAPNFNTQTLNCQKCPTEHDFIPSSNECVPYIYTFADNANLIVPSPNYLPTYNEDMKKKYGTRQIRKCPTSKPYAFQPVQAGDSQAGLWKCLSCQSGSYFVVASSQCIQGCPRGTTYESETRMCVAGYFITNPKANNLIVPDSTYEQWKLQTDSTLAQNSDIRLCPNEQPYVVDGVCAICEGDTPFYNIKTKRCEGCPKGRQYSWQQKRCLSHVTDTASLERMIANIV